MTSMAHSMDTVIMGHTCLSTLTVHIVSSDLTISQTGTQAGEGMRLPRAHSGAVAEPGAAGESHGSHVTGVESVPVLGLPCRV